MILELNTQNFFVFDLDDTLYKEVDFLKSAYRHIAAKLEKQIGKNISTEMIDLWYAGESVFDVIKEKYTFEEDMSNLVSEYRFHKPDISLSSGALALIKALRERKVSIGLMTDGRSKSQRNKLSALGIEKYFHEILISEEFGSEKPNPQNFQHFMQFAEADKCIYIGDNFKKDFISPNKLGWQTIGLLDDGNNIHKQDLTLGKEYLPQHLINSLQEINLP